jgi:hypothetical protein
MIHGRTYGFGEARAADAVVVEEPAAEGEGAERCWIWHGVDCEMDVVSSACETARS